MHKKEIEINIALKKSQIAKLQKEIMLIEEDLRVFTEKYISEFAELFKLENLKSQKIESEKPIENQKSFSEDEFSKLIKRKFKKLASHCHPDMNKMDKESANEMFKNLKTAYDAKDYGTILLIEEELIENANTEKQEEEIENYQLIYDGLVKIEQELLQKKQLILTCPKYILKNKIMLYRMKGIDLIAKIKESIK